jgi:3'-5' exoribonuclease
MFIEELKVNNHITSAVYQLRNASFREGEGVNGYYLMRLGDKTGQIDAIWLNTPNIKLKVGDFVIVDGKVQNYQGRLQLKLSACKKIDAESVNQTDFALYAVDKKKLKLKLENYIESIQIKPLYTVIKKILLEDLYDEFSNAPAATFNHHSYMGGLLEHSICVTDICNCFAEVYEDIDRDILIAGALIHDIGKIYEFDFNESISYSTRGNLMGHIYMGAHKFQQYTAAMDGFPEYIENSITHILLSHHGSLERGSPIEPCTMEAILVHKADTADADANAFKLSKMESAGGNWLISRTLNRMIYIEQTPNFEKRKTNE